MEKKELLELLDSYEPCFEDKFITETGLKEPVSMGRNPGIIDNNELFMKRRF